MNAVLTNEVEGPAEASPAPRPRVGAAARAATAVVSMMRRFMVVSVLLGPHGPAPLPALAWHRSADAKLVEGGRLADLGRPANRSGSSRPSGKASKSRERS